MYLSINKEIWSIGSKFEFTKQFLLNFETFVYKEIFLNLYVNDSRLH